MKAHRRQLGWFSNSCALFSSVQGGFLRKKPLIIVHSVHSNWRTAIARRRDHLSSDVARCKAADMDQGTATRMGLVGALATPEVSTLSIM